MVEAYVRVSARTAEDAVREVRGWSGRAGAALDAGLIMGVGPAVVAALDEIGPVAVLFPLSGPPQAVAAAASRLARFGAAWVTVAAPAGGDAITAAVEAVAGTGARIAVETLPVAVDDSAAAALIGSTRGRLVSRMAVAAAAAGASGVVCGISDLGVLAQVAPQLIGVVDGLDDDRRVGEALSRGAGVVVVSRLEAIAVLGGEPTSAPARRGRGQNTR